MKTNRTFPLIVLAGSVLVVAPLTRAQSVGQALGRALGQFFSGQNETASEDQLRSFNHFLHNDPDTAAELQRRPELVNDRGFVDHHPALRDWMNSHPDAAEAFRDNPGAFMNQERHFQYYERDFASGDTRRGELAHFDWFLDSHPEIRDDLTRRPELALRANYLDNHPELRAFLDRHPVVRDELRDDPRGFMDREARLESRHEENRDRDYQDRYQDNH